MISLAKIRYQNLANFRFTKLDGKYLLTTDTGRWIFLTEGDFKKFLEGTLGKDTSTYRELKESGFVKLKPGDVSEQASRYLALNASLAQGPSLFIFVLTLQCNHRCLYCQVIPEKKGATGFDMTKEVAKKSVDLMFQSPSPLVRIEFQGGEPLLNWPVLKYIVTYAKKVNATAKKGLEISLVTNLTLIDEEKLAYLLRENVSLSVSLDGPASVHDRNRIYLDGRHGSHKTLLKNLRMVRKAIEEWNRDGRRARVSDSIGATMTTTRFSLPYPKEIVDEYRKDGFHSIFLRPLSPFGLERQAIDVIGYSAEEFVAFYEEAFDYILELNLAGERFVEWNAVMALKKILNHRDASYYEMRSPCGAGIGQMAFDYDGRIFTCDEGRMAERMGHDMFRLGTVQDDRYADVVDNEVNRTMCLGSSLDNQAGCNDCVYKPYCGICPLANFIEYGTIFPQILNTDRHKINKALFDLLFTKLRDDRYRRIFEDWLKHLSQISTPI
ncbi:MAG: His-Xaa-Ser system radical SAM maturase HxsB [Candidatus Moraniibacteriota bacterium]